MEDYIGAPGVGNLTDSLESEFKETMRNDTEQYYVTSSMKSDWTSDVFGNTVLENSSTHGIEYTLLDNCRTVKYKSIPPDFQTTIDENFEKLLEEEGENVEPIHENLKGKGLKDFQEINFDLVIGKKESKDKLNYELDFYFIKQMAERMSANKGTYPPYNWKKPIDIEGLKQANFRHILEIMEGRYEDDGREFGHLEALALNSMFINYQLKSV